MISSSCLAVVLVCPPVCRGQWPSSTPPLPLSVDPANQVSARELQIPPKARKFFNQGTQLLAEHKAADSLVALHRAISAFPGFYEAYYKIGLADLNLQRYADAQSAFETSIQLSKGRYAPSQFGLGIVLCTEKQYGQAEEAVRAGLRNYSADATGNFTLAWVLFSAGRLPEAEKSARQAIIFNSDLAEAYLLLGQIHLKQNDLVSLLSDLDAYVKLRPGEPRMAQAIALRDQAQQLLAKQQGTSPVLAKVPNH
jgi:tetratricopeptide (TPR) repeat protein